MRNITDVIYKRYKRNIRENIRGNNYDLFIRC